MTCNVGVIHAGTRPNVVAEEARLEVDLRAVRGEDLDAAVAAVRELMAAPAVPDVTMDMETMASLAADGEARAVRAARRHRGRARRAPRLPAQGRGDRRRLGRQHDVRAWACPSLDGLGPIGGNDHAPGEYLEVGSIVPRTTLAAGLLLAVARDPVVGLVARRLISSGGPYEARTATAGRSWSATRAGWPARPTPGPTGGRRHPGDAGAQARAAFAIIAAALAEAGFGLADVVRTRMFVTDMAHLGGRAGRPRGAVRRRSGRRRRSWRSARSSSRACSSRSRSTPGAADRVAGPSRG